MQDLSSEFLLLYGLDRNLLAQPACLALALNVKLQQSRVPARMVFDISYMCGPDAMSIERRGSVVGFVLRWSRSTAVGNFRLVLFAVWQFLQLEKPEQKASKSKASKLSVLKSTIFIHSSVDLW